MATKKVKLSFSEKRVVAKIKRTIHPLETKYMFWFVYDSNGEAKNWQGGYDLSLTQQFRNQYTIEKGKSIVRNW